MDNRVKEAFDSIHAEEQLKKSTKEFLVKELYSTKSRKTGSRGWYQKGRQLAVVAACFLMIIVGVAGYDFCFTEVSAISIDINPSIELGINRFDRVISVEGYNEDGDRLAEKLDIRFMNYAEAMDEILEDEDILSYMENEEQMAVTIISDDAAKEQEMLTNVNHCTASHRNVHCRSGKKEEVEAAHHAGLSFGKYQAFLELQALDSSITVEDVEGLTMREIRVWIEALSEESNDISDSLEVYDNNSNHHKEHGGGHGKGH